MVTLKSPKPRYLWLSGVPFCLCGFRPLLGPVKSRRAKLEEQKCSPSAEGFLFAALGPRAARPLNPRQGVPPAPHAYKRLPAIPAGASRRGAGVPGEERPRHPAGRLGSLRSRQGAVSSPLRGCGPHQPLDPPFTEKRARGPRRGLRGTVGVDGGQGSRSDRAAAWP